MSPRVSALRAALAPLADPVRSASMRAYLKTEQPMFGAPHAALKVVFREVFAAHPAADRADWEAGAREMWAEPERELRYAALAWVKGSRKRYLTREALPLLEELVRDGAWWDLCDDLATNALGTLVARDPAGMAPVLRAWGADPHLWVRRCAVLAQVKRRGETDRALLFELCLSQAGDRTFWMRKAIGWALRELSRHDPEAVRAFLAAHPGRLAGLAVREASRKLPTRTES